MNRNLHLPDREIAVVHRSDGSGTTFIWTDYFVESEPGVESRRRRRNLDPVAGGKR
ncbi:hypothetical protein SBA4_2960016 [Candidatus Sulfopaludibacter sp. SbA4]|nr:hypothetical protein SBA4_2960016 [Candidatus Sulfopaludibacter sp. SbA4]